MISDSRIIECPIRKVVVPANECNACPNEIRVQFRGEYPPEQRCAEWRRNMDMKASGRGDKSPA